MSRRLSEVNPEGRLDVYAFRVLMNAVGAIERRLNVEGLVEAVEPDIEKLVRSAVSPRKLPLKRYKKLAEGLLQRGVKGVRTQHT